MEPNMGFVVNANTLIFNDLLRQATYVVQLVSTKVRLLLQ